MKTVFFDIDTQFDFLLPAGALYVPGAEKLIPTLTKLARFAELNKIPLISTLDAHGDNDAEFATWNPHCVVGTAGQQKPPSTLLSKSFILPSTPVDSPYLREDAITAPQIQIEKQQTDCFTNANLKPLLALLKPELCTIYGVVTEVCVQQAAWGLLELGYAVQIVSDAVQSFDSKQADVFFKSVESKGGRVTTASAVLG